MLAQPAAADLGMSRTHGSIIKVFTLGFTAHTRPLNEPGTTGTERRRHH